MLTLSLGASKRKNFRAMSAALRPGQMLSKLGKLLQRNKLGRIFWHAEDVSYSVTAQARKLALSAIRPALTSKSHIAKEKMM